MRRLMLALAVVALVLSTGCAKPSVKPIATTVTVTEKDAGKTISLEMGDTLQVMLDGNPTTGYQWQASRGTGAVLKAIGKPEFKPESKQVGAPGKVTLRFAAGRPGRTRLELVYRRPWEKGVEPEKTYEVTVDVER